MLQIIIKINYKLIKKIMRIRWAGHVAHMRRMRIVYRVLVEKPKWKGQCGRPKLMWEDNIKK